MKFQEYFREIQPGEAVLVEYTSRSKAPLLFKVALETFSVEEALVIDVADIGMTFKKSLELTGLWDEKTSSVRVIKLGGKIKWGRLLGHYDVYTDPRVFIGKIESIINSELPPRKAVVALGTERISMIHSDSRRVSLYLANCAAAKLGDPNLVSVYFINRDISEGEFLGMMREIATRAILLDEEGAKAIKPPLWKKVEAFEP